MIKIYIAGPMRGIPLFNFPAFDAAAKELRAKGFHVFSPAEMDRIFSPKDEGNIDGQGAASPIHSYIRRDVHIIINELVPPYDGIVLLPGWESSTGAIAERALGLWCRLRVDVLKNWLR